MSQTVSRAKKKSKRRNDPLLIFACVLGIAVLIAIGFVLKSMNKQNVGSVTGWNIIDGETYFIDAITKKPATGLNTIGNRVYFFQPDGKIQGGWADYEGEKIFVKDDGSVVTGECEIDGELYSFAFDTCKMLKDSYVEQSDGQAYYFGSDGKAVKSKICTINDEERYFDEEGKLVRSNWITTLDDDDAYYYADKDGNLVTGKVTIQGQVHYFNEDHKAATGKKTIDGVEYNFDSRGYDASMNPVTTTAPSVTKVPPVTTSPSVTTSAPVTTVVSGSVSSGVSSVSKTPETSKPEVKFEGWREVNGKKQYIYENGSAAKGVVRIEDALYVFNDAGELSGAGWIEINGKRYYADENGKAKTGFAEIDGKTYYFDSTGKTLRGIQSINGSVYDLSDSGEVIKNRFADIDGNRYYFDENGRRVKGFKEIDGSTYYFTEVRVKEGIMQRGYIKVNGSEYYMDDEGRMVNGWVTMGNCKYYFTPNPLKNGTYDVEGQICTFDADGVLLDEDGYPA